MINSKWSSNLKGKDKENLDSAVKNSSMLLDRLTEIVQQQIQTLECPTKADYDSSSWAYKQADRNGQLRAYRDILTLTDRKGKTSD